jgi:2-polyprenyl-3-methyl-5-hydroxy-6-metoxy-1,4-benzoquinol methylase
MPELVPCDLCGSSSTRLLYSRKDYRLRVDETSWNVVQCRACGLAYVNPRPTIEEIARYYPPRYYEGRADEQDRYRRQAEYIPPPAGDLLDVGAARGDFLAVMRALGWRVAGIEPFEDAGNPHGLPIHRIHFPDAAQTVPGRFDVITAWAVFEHLHRPAAAFAACADLLRPAGRLIVQVPNLRSIQSRWTLQEDVPRHLYFFSPRTLRSYAERSGLTLERVVHTTDLFGGSGRGALPLALFRLLRRSPDDYVRMYSLRRSARLRQWPVLTLACLALALTERMLLSDWLVRTTHFSGQIVAYFRQS